MSATETWLNDVQLEMKAGNALKAWIFFIFKVASILQVEEKVLKVCSQVEQKPDATHVR